MDSKQFRNRNWHSDSLSFKDSTRKNICESMSLLWYRNSVTLFPMNSQWQQENGIRFFRPPDFPSTFFRFLHLPFTLTHLNSLSSVKIHFSGSFSSMGITSRISSLGQGSTDRHFLNCVGPGPARSKIFENLLVLVRFGPWFSKTSRFRSVDPWVLL